jgi:hypothetical protein
MPHLHVVVTGISTVLTHLLVNFSSTKPGVNHDPTCIVPPGVHPLITQESFIAYQFARIELASDLANKVGTGTFQTSDPIDAALLAKIQAGIAVSGYCPMKFQTYFARNQNNP